MHNVILFIDNKLTINITTIPVIEQIPKSNFFSCQDLNICLHVLIQSNHQKPAKF